MVHGCARVKRDASRLRAARGSRARSGFTGSPNSLSGAVTDGASPETFIDRDLATSLGFPEFIYAIIQCAIGYGRRADRQRAQRPDLVNPRVLTQTDDPPRRHGRARPGHLRTAAYALPFPWMPGTRPGMTIKLSPNHLNESEH